MNKNTVTELENEIRACISKSRAYWNSQLYSLANLQLEKARRLEKRLALTLDTGDYK